MSHCSAMHGLSLQGSVLPGAKRHLAGTDRAFLHKGLATRRVSSAVVKASFTEREREEKEKETIRDIVAYTRQKAALPAVQPVKKEPSALGDFFTKVRAAWQIFFPPDPVKNLTPKEEGKHRLRMILVADRCGMNPSMLTEMKSSIVEVVSEYVDIEAEELVDVSVTTDNDMGTIYSVSLPVKRVKPQARLPWGGDAEVQEAPQGVTVEWEDWDKDPAARFPWGT